MKKKCKGDEIFRVMKCTIFLMLFFAFGLKANVYSQNDVVNLRMKDVSLVGLFDELEKITGVKFLYNADLVKAKGNVSVEAVQKPFGNLLREVLTPMGLTYSLNGDQVIISRLQTAAPQTQAYSVKGKVTDRKGSPLPGATVRIDGTSVGTATDEKGMFALTLPNEKGVLEFSFVGCKSLKMPYASGKFMNVQLEDQTSNLDEVTVIAYGQRKKRELIGSVSSVKADEIKELPTPSLESLLQGRMAGLGVNIQSGAPGSGGNNVAIRGYNSLLDDESGFKSNGAPLYVIDGVPVHSFTSPVTGTNTIAEIDPSTIESVEVLKDAASAAIYGSRAANGVILITTKKGKAGRGKFSANFSYTASILPEAPTQFGGKGERQYVMAMMEATKTAYYDKSTGMWKYPTSPEEAAANGVDYNLFYDRGQGKTSGSYMKMLQDSLNPFFNNSTNWYKYLFRVGKVLNANIQTSGGSDVTNYLIGAGYYKEVGIMPGSDFVRANLLSNLSVKPLKNLSIDSRIYLAYTDRSRGQGGGGGGGYEQITVDPAYTSTLLPAGGAVEAKILQMMNGQKETNTSYRLRGNLVLAYQVIEGLNISTSLSLDYNQANQNFFRPSYLEPTYRESKSSGEVSRDMLLSNENLINYNFSVKNVHNFDILAGLAYDANKMWSIGGYGLRGPSDMIEYVGNGFSDLYYSVLGDEYRALQKYTSDFTETSMVSYFGRIAYNYDKKYLIEATFRRDGSSVFGSDVRWATFPSVALGWAFSEENFMRWAWWMDFAKLRASWGRTGSQFGIPYLAQGLMETGGVFDGIQGMTPSGVVNHKLKWEQSDQYDVGLDLDMFEYRIGLSMDYYYKYTGSLIHRVPLPGDVYGNGGVQWRNAMAVSNEGLELEAKIDILRSTAVKWKARFNISKNWNRFEKSYSGTDIPGQMVIGRSMSGIYLYQDEGFVESEKDIPYVYDESGKIHYLAPEGDESAFYTVGMRKMADLNGDGMITEDDMFYAGSTLPKAYGGFASELKWKDFDLNVLLTFTLGRNMVNVFRTRTAEPNDTGTKPIFFDPSSSGFWQNPGDEATYPAPGLYPSIAMQYSGLYTSNLEKVSFCKLKQLTLGYNVPKEIMNKIRLEGIRLFITGENLLSLSNYSGLDPEVVDLHSGVDQGLAYPLARKWTFGVTVNF